MTSCRKGDLSPVTRMKGCAYPVFGDNRIPLHMAITNFRFQRVAASCVELFELHVFLILGK